MRLGANFPFGSESASPRVKNGMESAENAFTIRSRGLLTVRSRERGTSGPRSAKNAAFLFSPAPYQRSATSPNVLSPWGHGTIRATDFDAGFQHPASGHPRALTNRNTLAEQALGRHPLSRPLTTGSLWLFCLHHRVAFWARSCPAETPRWPSDTPDGATSFFVSPSPRRGLCARPRQKSRGINPSCEATLRSPLASEFRLGTSMAPQLSG
jgi:hypothetical protein